MKNAFNKISGLYHSHNIDFFCSLLGPLVMGTIHLVSTCMHFDWIVLNYCLFSYTVLLAKVWLFSIEKFNLKPKEYVAGIISLVVIILPMMASIILTIRYKDAPHYLFDWLVYAYALYGTLKFVLAIRGIVKTKASSTARSFSIAWIGLLSALYTIQMMEFKLIMFASDGEIDTSMFFLQLFSQGFIFLFSIFIIVLFAIKLKKESK